jgi:hypothetical protein
MRRQTILGLEDDQGKIRIARQQLVRRGHAHDAAANDGHVVRRRGHGVVSPRCGFSFSRSYSDAVALYINPQTRPFGEDVLG